nr:hypothetical protein BaRGS_000219 [Batillaria attramentaria]
MTDQSFAARHNTLAKNTYRVQDKSARFAGAAGGGDDMEINDTEWPLEKTLFKAESTRPTYARETTKIADTNGSTMNRPAVKGDELLKTDPGSLARHSITMLYTPKPTKPEPEPKPEPPKPKPSFGGFSSLLKPKLSPPEGEFEKLLQCPRCHKRLLNPKRA